MDSRIGGLGTLSIFPDNLISEFILSKLLPEDLGRSARVSRFFYIFSRDDQLWKKHCLDKWGDNKEVMENFVFRGSWLLTYLFPNLLSENEEKEKVLSHPVCRPLRFPDISSHYLYAKWCRCNMFLGNFLPDYSYTPPELRFPIEDGKLLTKEKFESLYDSQSIPVLIKNCDVEEWKAWKNWRIEEFVKKYHESKFKIANERGGKNGYFSMSLKSYYDYIIRQHDETPLYIFDPNFGEKYPELVEEYKIPKYFDQDLFSVLGDKRPPFRWIIIGPARSGASWHVDPVGTSAWNTVIEGRKRWALYPPNMYPPGLSISSAAMNGHQSIYNLVTVDDSKDPTTSLFWYLEVYPQLPPELKPIEIIQEPGQTIFVPSGWWHMVLNLDDSIAVTQNFVNIHNLENVCESLITEKNEKIWEKFHDNLIKCYPYFEKYLSKKFSMFDDSTNDSIIIQEGFSSKMEFIEGFKNLNVWHDRVIEVLNKHNLNNNKSIKVISSGQNPVFRTSKLIIKFYSHLFNGLKNFYSETNSYSLINNYLPSKYKKYFSKILGSGYLYEDNDEKKNNNDNKYQWPYIIIEDANTDETDINKISLDDNEDSLKFSNGISLSIIINNENFDLNNQGSIINWDELIGFIAEILYVIHSLPSHNVSFNNNAIIKKSSNFHDYISRQISMASNNHLSWLIFPVHLILQISEYLPKSSLELYDPNLDGEKSAGLLHGDLNSENILGVISEINNDNTGKDDPINKKQWKPNKIIDLGDSLLFGGDPLFDLIPIHISIFNCSKLLLKSFIEKYNNQSQQLNQSNGNGNSNSNNNRDLKISTRSFKKRAMWYTLLWSYEGAAKHLLEYLPNIRECKNWEEVEDLVWNIEI